MSNAENVVDAHSLITGDNLIKHFTSAVFSKSKEFVPVAASILETGLQITQSDHPGSISAYLNVISKIRTATSCIKELFEIQNQLVFLKSIQQGNIELEGFAKRQEALRQGEAWVYREVEKVAVYLSRNTDTFKAKLQAQLYLDYIGGTITINKFHECLDIIDQLIIHDKDHLLEIREYEEREGISISDPQSFLKKTEFNYKLVECHRLSALGLMVPMSGFSFAVTTPHHYALTELGRYICDIIKKQDNPDE